MKRLPGAYGDGMEEGALGSDDGQMVVEMAVVTPVMLVVAIVVLNLMWFLEAAARFDRIVPDLVMTVAVSPPGDAVGEQEHAITAALERTMDGLRGVSVSVRAETGWDELVSGVGLSIAPHLTKYVCTMAYTPWPSMLSVAGIDAGIPVVMTHERSFVIDRYRPGVVF